MKFLIIAKKEMIDITRDKRTILMMVAVPLLMVPILMGSMMKIVSSQAEKASAKQLKVRFVGEEHAPNLYQAFTEMDKVIMLNQIPIDSIQSYIQEEFLDAAIYVNPTYSKDIAGNGQANIQIHFKGTDSFDIARDRIKAVLKVSENQIISSRMDRLNIQASVVKAYDCLLYTSDAADE